MLREIDLNEISDGRLYTSGDLARADCQGCKGCSACCRGMGSSIVLDPYDMFCLSNGLGVPAESLLNTAAELHVVDGIILPDLKMKEGEDCCTFLNENGRCEIHSFRPGFCRMFPLGRIYENRSFYYFLQTKECPKENRTKVKIKKWIGIPDFKRYERFINDWHYLLKDLANSIPADSPETYLKQVSMYLLQTFYLTPYPSEGFYEAFDERNSQTKRLFRLSD